MPPVILAEMVMGNVDLPGRVQRRHAVRAVVQDGRNLLMTYASSIGDYGFAGGGIEDGETPEQALRRELREETGADLLEVGPSFGVIIQSRPSSDSDYDVFQSVHEYFPCQVREGVALPLLESYERDLGLVSRWVDLEVALAANRAISAGLVADNPWIPREIIMLEVLLDRARKNEHAGVPDAGSSPRRD